MKTFNSIEELKPYYNEKTNTYEFIENGLEMNVEFTFNLDVCSHILAKDIKAVMNIKALNINADDIKAAMNIKADDIDAKDINAGNIKAGDINYYAVCFAYKNIICTSIKGRRENAKHFVLDGEITIKPKKKVTLELNDEQLEKIREVGK